MTAHHGMAWPALATVFIVATATGSTLAQSSTTRSVVEQPTLNGDSRASSEVETRTNEVAPGTTETTRREYGTDANGDSTLLATMAETRVISADGRESVVREFSHPDINGRPEATRRETSETVPEGDGVFRTEIEVSTPDASGTRFVVRERVEQVERRDGPTVESESITYTNLTNRADWQASEQRVVTQTETDTGTESVENVYRPDGTGSMVHRNQTVRTEWTGSRGETHIREEVFATDIAGQGRTSELRFHQQIDTVQRTSANGSIETTREVTEERNGRDVVVERVIERSRSDGRGGTVVERETQRRDVNGRLRTVTSGTTHDR